MTKNFRSKILAIILIAVILIGLFLPIKAQATNITEEVQTTNTVEETTESETATNIYYISSELDLSQIGVYGGFTGTRFILTNDLELSGEWLPFSNDFRGIFDGGGHTITYNINETTGALADTQYLGLFGACTDAIIKNLYVNGNISLTTGGSFFNPSIYTGGIVGSSTNSVLENVHFSGNINITTSNDNSPWVGGLVGQATNTQILLSSNTAQITVEADSYIGIVRTGGLCGEFSGTIENCYNKGDVQATAAIDSPYAGGIVGINSGTITKSYNSGKVQSKGPSTSLSNIYAGGIVALGETGSSVTDCAVMSPEISVATGWINTGYKYIISNGGSKSNNISINSITGSPTNDSNTRYTQAELKTSTPYENFDFLNTWAIDGTSNDGYPYHYRNSYAINLEDQLVPQGLMSFIEGGYIDYYDLRQTNDGFTLCIKPLDEILSRMSIDEVRLDVDDAYTLESLEDWYIFNIGTSYSILKMRTDAEKERIGTSIPFMDFNIELLNLLHNDITQQVEDSIYEKQLYEEIKRVTNGETDFNCTFSIPIATYFSTEEAKANYLIAEEYIRKVMSTERDTNGYIDLPEGLGSEQIEFLSRFPDIYDAENDRIKINSYNLTYAEKCAILSGRTANKSINNYAAENIIHAKWTVRAGLFMQGTEGSLVLPTGIVLTRPQVRDIFESAIKSDAGIGEEPFAKDNPYFGFTEDTLKGIFGDI